MMDNITYKKAYQFAIRIVNAYKFLSEKQKEFVLSKQLLRSGTSMGANISEANGAISKQGHFILVLSILCFDENRQFQADNF